MAAKWKEAQPQKNIVIVELGYPKNAAYKTEYTEPFVKGVQCVDPAAKDLGCMDISKGADQPSFIYSICVKSIPNST